MTFSAVGTLTPITGSGSSIAMTVAPPAIGNCYLLNLNWQASTLNFSTVTSTNITWIPWGAGKVTTSVFGTAIAFENFIGVAKSTASATSTFTLSGSSTAFHGDYQQFHTDAIAPVWTEVANGSLGTSSSVKPMPGPSIVAPAGDLYWGFWSTGDTGNTTGSGTGFTTPFAIDAAANVGAYSLSTQAGANQPTANQTTASIYFSVGIVVRAQPLWTPTNTNCGTI